MQIFVDSCDVKEIEELATLNLIDGVTTNPSLVLKSGKDFHTSLKEICAIVPTSVSAEVIAATYDEMLKEAEKLLKISKHITIKLPMTFDGLRAAKVVKEMGATTNITLCFNATQAILAAKVGATYVSPFIGRLDDMGDMGIRLIEEIKDIYSNYPNFETKILAASIRTIGHVIEAARIGADVVTLPPQLIKQMVRHPLTDKGLEIFLADWKKTGQTI